MRDFSITALPPEAFDPEHMHRVNGVREQCDYLVQQNLTTVAAQICGNGRTNWSGRRWSTCPSSDSTGRPSTTGV